MEAALGKLLVEKGGIPAERLDEVERVSALQGGRLDTCLLEHGLIDEAQLTDLLARAYDLQPADFRALVKVDLQALKTIPSRVAERCQVFPFLLDGSDLHVLVPAPPDLALLEEIGAMVSRRLVPHVATEYRIARALSHFYGLPLKGRFSALEHALEGRAPAATDVAATPAAAPDSEAAPVPRPAADRVQWDLAGALARLAAANDRDSVVAITLTYARAFLETVAFFGINAGRVVGWDAIGPGVTREDFKGLTLSLDEASALRTAIDSRALFLGQISRNAVHDAMYRALGTRRPRSGLLFPVMTAGRVIAVVYGDNDRRAIRTAELADLIAFCGRIGAAFENIILARKRTDGSAVAVSVATAPAPAATAAPATPEAPAAPATPAPEATTPERPLDVFAPAAAVAADAAAPADEFNLGVDSGDELVFDTGPATPEAADPPAVESPLEAWLNREPTPRAPASEPVHEPSLATVLTIGDDEVLPDPAAAGSAVTPVPPPASSAAAPAPAIEAVTPEPTVAAAPIPDLEDEAPAPGWEKVVYETLGADGIAAAVAPAASAAPAIVVGTPIAEPSAAVAGDEKVAFDEDEEPARPGEESVVFEDIDESRGAATWTSALAYAIEQGHQGGETGARPAAVSDEVEAVAFDEIVSEVAAAVTPAPAGAGGAVHDTIVDLKPAALAAIAAVSGDTAAATVAEPAAETAPLPSVIVAAEASIPSDALEIGTPREPALDATIPLSDLDLRHLCDTVAGPTSDEANAAAQKLLHADARIIPMLSSRFPGRVRFDPFGQDWGLPEPGALSPVIWLLSRRHDIGTAVAFAHLDSHFPALRWFAVYLFTRLHEPRAIKSLLPRLHDEEPRIRHLTAEALRHYSADAGFDTVIKHLRGRLESPVAEVRRRAIYFLGFFKDLRSVPHLISCLAAREPELVAEALQALTAITMQTLGPAQKKWVKWWDKNRHRNRIEWLIEGLRHSDRNIRYAAHLELAAVAHESFDYNYDGKKGDREKAAKRFEKWWSSERKRMRLEEQ